jgi:xanthine dehydrogenase YagR molybdenum-binding subunit
MRCEHLGRTQWKRRHNGRPPDMRERSWSAYSFGAHFCEVAVDMVLEALLCNAGVAAFSAGRIPNEKTARSQLMGGIV